MRRSTAAALLMIPLLALPLAAQEHQAHEGAMDHSMHHAPAPTEGLRAELVADIQQLEEKYLSLARAMTGRFDWRPADGVRSVGEVFGHVADANFMIPSMAGAEREMADRRFEAEDEAGILEGLEHSFMHARNAIADVPDAELDDEVTMFGQPATKRQVLTLLVTHMHEHLGQAIAYARSTGVTPPWSAGS